MNIVFLLLIVSLSLVMLIACIFYWTVNSGQYDDLDSPSFDLINDNDNINDDGDDANDLSGHHSRNQ